MIRPLLSLEQLSFEKKEGKVGYRYGKNEGEQAVSQELLMAADVSAEYFL